MYAVILCLAIGAPAPVYKERIEHVTPGHYTMTWSTGHPIIYNLELKADGSLEAKLGFYTSYKGYWRYDRKTRILSLQERNFSDEVSIDWQVLLDKKLSGKGCAVWVRSQDRKELTVVLKKK